MFLLIKDILKRKGIDVRYYPTEQMIADFFTKPIQYKYFRWLRDIVMGLMPFPVEECVGLYNNSPKNSIVEECLSDVRCVENGKSAKKKVSWAEVLMNNVTHEKGT